MWASLGHSEVHGNALCGLFWWPSLGIIEKGQQTLIKPHLMSWKVSVIFLLQCSSSLDSASWVSQEHLQPEGDQIYLVSAFPDLDGIRVANLCSLPLWQRIANPLENSLDQPFLFAFATEACVSCNKHSTHIYIVWFGSTVYTRLPGATLDAERQTCKKDLGVLWRILNIWSCLKLESRAVKLSESGKLSVALLSLESKGLLGC